MADGVRKRLLKGAIKHQLGVCPNRSLRSGAIEHDLQRVLGLEVPRERSQRRYQSQVVERSRAKVARHAANRLDAFPDQGLRPVEPFSHFGVATLLQQPELHVERREYLRGFVVQLTPEPIALLFVLVNHPRLKSFELLGAGLEAAVQVLVLQRGSDLLPECDQKAAIEHREGVAGFTDHDESPDDLLFADHRQGSGISMRPIAEVARSLAAANRRQPRPLHELSALARCGRRAFKWPKRSHSGAVHERATAVGRQIQCGSMHAAQRERPPQHRLGDWLFLAAPPLQLARQRGQRTQPLIEVLEDEE